MSDLTFDEAAAALNLRPNTAHRFLIDEGRLPTYVENGVRMVKRADFDDYIERRDAMMARLDEARRNRRTLDEQIADELGLDPDQARTLGLNIPKD